MLRNLGIRWQILSALALPVLVLGLISSQVTYQALVDMRAASQSRELATAGTGFAVLVNGLATERALSGEVLLGIPGADKQLTTARAAVDRELTGIRAQIADVTKSSKDDAVQRTISRLAAEHALIPALRADVDSGKAQPRAIIVRYSEIIGADVNLPFDLADTITDEDQAANFRSFGQLGLAIEALAEEQLTGASAILSGKPSTIDQRDLGAAEAAAQQALAGYARTALPSQKAALQAALAAPSAATASLAADRAAMTRAGTTTAPAVSLLNWTADTGAQIGAIRTVFNRISADGVTLATSDYDSARNKLRLTLAGALGITLLTLLLAFGLSRRVAAPLRRLTLAATQIRDELPRLVASLQSDHEFELHLPVVSTVGRNEVSQLAAAFVDVNAVTVEIAREQARLRGAIADMFVNVARRNQVLLGRQLAFIDQLERNEVNPDALEELFRLDHLATRMRRNAESLLVLAGIESGRRLRDPMPLSDVVRTATSEIEHYSRVQLSLAVDPPVFAHLALPIAHLLAELLENATNFSDPGSTVVVMATPTEHGVRVTVADDGLGMAPDELAEINARIDEPPTADALSSQRLGFFVVGRLAQRLDAKVTLTSGRSRGTAVLIDLPATLFIPGAIDNPGYAPPAALGQAPSQPSQPSVPSQPTAREQASVPALAASPALSARALETTDAPSSPFVDAYPVAFTAGAGVESIAPAAAPLAAGPAPIAAPIPMPSAPVLPASFNADALTAEADAQPTWMPQPDELPFGSPAGAVVEPQIVPGAPLARRGAAPVAPVPVEPAPAAEPTVVAEPVASEWADSEWAPESSSAPSWAASDWATTPQPTKPAQSAAAEPDQAWSPSSASSSPAPTPAAPTAAGSSLFSGFRSRREGSPTTESIALQPVEAPAPPRVVGTAEFMAPQSGLESTPAAPAAPVTPLASIPEPEPVQEWAATPVLPSQDSDRWQAWAEVSAASAPVVEGEPEDDGYPPTPGLAAAYLPELPEIVIPPLYTPEAYQPAAYPAEPPANEPQAYEPPAYEPVAYEPPAAYQPQSYEQAAYEPPTAYEPQAYEPAAYQPPAYEPQGYEPQAYEPQAYESATYSPEPELFVPQTELFVPQDAPAAYIPEQPGYSGEPSAGEPEPESGQTGSTPSGGELQMRTLTAAIDILPQRTTIRTALRRGGRRKTDGPASNEPFTGGFDPIEPAREYARREGFSDSASSMSPITTGLPAELNGIGGATSAMPEAGLPWDQQSAAERRQHPRPSTDAEGTERNSSGRSALASEALSELSRLSSYSPTSMPATAAPALQRRPPSELPLDEPEPVEASGRTRTAASVRSMLAGFKAGVERGRTSPSANRPAPDREGGALPQPRHPAGRDE